MKISLLSTNHPSFDNIIVLWCCNFAWFIASCFILFTNMQKNNLNGEPLIFLLTMIFIVLVGGFNAFTNNKIRSYISLFIDCMTILLLPLIFYSFGLSIETSLLIAYINIVVIIALAPLIQLIFCCTTALTLAFLVSFGNYFENPELYEEIKANRQYNDANVKVKDMPFIYYQNPKPMTIQEVSSSPKVYGNSDYWYTIFKTNSKIITSPTQIIPKDTIIRIPKHRGTSYKIKILTVAKKSSLQDIAGLESTYNNSKLWKIIYNANQSKINNKEQMVERGTNLIIPALQPSKQDFFFKVSIIFVSAVILALIWKFTIGKIYKMLNIAYSVESRDAFDKIDNYETKVTELNEDVQLLKHELAVDIIKMRHTLENNDL